VYKDKIVLMKSIDPNDFKVVKPIKLSELPSNPKIGASDDKKEDKLTMSGKIVHCRTSCMRIITMLC
jgi:hypothetical protein